MSISLMLLFPSQWKLAWLPYGIFIADMLENTGIITLLLNYGLKIIRAKLIGESFLVIGINAFSCIVDVLYQVHKFVVKPLEFL